MQPRVEGMACWQRTCWEPILKRFWQLIRRYWWWGWVNRVKKWSSITRKNVTLVKNNAEVGGAVYVKDSLVDNLESDFIENVAEQQGEGAVHFSTIKYAVSTRIGWGHWKFYFWWEYGQVWRWVHICKIPLYHIEHWLAVRCWQRHTPNGAVLMQLIRLVIEGRTLFEMYPLNYILKLFTWFLNLVYYYIITLVANPLLLKATSCNRFFLYCCIWRSCVKTIFYSNSNRFCIWNDFCNGVKLWKSGSAKLKHHKYWGF